MATLEIQPNSQYKEVSAIIGTLSTGLKGRIQRVISPRKRVETSIPHLKTKLDDDTALSVRFAQQDPIEDYTPETFAAYLGEWLNEQLDGDLARRQIIVTVVIARGNPGVWKRKP